VQGERKQSARRGVADSHHAKNGRESGGRKGGKDNDSGKIKKKSSSRCQL
jgi:hypothetical protein